MILVLKAIIIAIIEGITEFLPVSSTGHMIIFDDIIGFKASAGTDFANMFEIVIQLGAILAIVVLYWNKIVDSFKHLEEYGLRLWLGIIIAFIPSAAIGFLIHKPIKKYLFNSFTVAAGLIVGGLLMIYMEKKYRKKATVKDIDDVNAKQALRIGFFQCLALWPGMSRSASTMIGAWVSGLSNSAAAEFSFFLALPTMIAASGLELKDADFSTINSTQIIALIVGFIVAFLVALLVVDRFVAFLKKKPMRVFSLYRILVGIVILILVATGVLGFIPQ